MFNLFFMTLPRSSRNGIYDLSYVIQIAGPDDGFVVEMLRYFIQNTPVVLDRLNEYAHDKQWDKLAAEAHRFSPGLSFLGIKTMDSKVRRVEDCASGQENLDELPVLVDEIRQTGLEVVDILKNDFNIR